MREALLQEYQAVRNSAGLLDCSARGKIEVRGPDRVSFLHALITNDVKGLEEGQGRYGALLTARGRMVADFFYYRLADCLLLDTSPSLAEETCRTLSGYIIMDDVEVRDVSGEWCHFSVEGPLSEDLLAGLVAAPLPVGVGDVKSLGLRGIPVLLVRKDEVAKPGYELLAGRGEKQHLEQQLLGAGSSIGLRRVGPEAYEVLRLEAGIPRFGVDMDGGRYPMEARLDRAISLTKGCYVGQEVVAKATHVGGVNNLLMGLRLSGRQVPPRGASVTDEAGVPVGKVTSAAYSPRFSGSIALAYLKRAFAESGRKCRIQMEDGATASGEVVESF